MNVGSGYPEMSVNRHVRELFRQLPRLSGFRLGAELGVAEVSACRTSGGGASGSLRRMVMQAIVELAECHPEVLENMRGRSFVRDSTGNSPPTAMLGSA
jgi:hypothetical protein